MTFRLDEGGRTWNYDHSHRKGELIQMVVPKSQNIMKDNLALARLQGSIVSYTKPYEPVGEGDWEAYLLRLELLREAYRVGKQRARAKGVASEDDVFELLER